ncbi:hypothetical protein KAT59_02875 [Candidatus Bipolaricaulota bacterium]|nr:hypothetical protein [Candidatus Bipolaricaulota bacterium]
MTWCRAGAQELRFEVLPALAANRHTPDVLFMGNNAAGPDEMIEALEAPARSGMRV